MGQVTDNRYLPDCRTGFFIRGWSFIVFESIGYGNLKAFSWLLWRTYSLFIDVFIGFSWLVKSELGPRTHQTTNLKVTKHFLNEEDCFNEWRMKFVASFRMF